MSSLIPRLLCVSCVSYLLYHGGHRPKPTTTYTHPKTPTPTRPHSYSPMAGWLPTCYGAYPSDFPDLVLHLGGGVSLPLRAEDYVSCSLTICVVLIQQVCLCVYICVWAMSKLAAGASGAVVVYDAPI